AWRHDDMTLLEYLRKSNASGDIVHWLQKAHAAADTALDLAAFAQEYRTFGEKIVAAETVSIFNDKFFGQWMMLHLPFRSAADLVPADIADKVPVRYSLFACAVRLAPTFWDDDSRIRAHLELAAHRDAYIDNALAMIRAQKPLASAKRGSDLCDAAGLPRRPAFNQAQLAFEEQALKRLEWVSALKSATVPEDIEEASARLEERNSILVCLGAPGTGKTFVADYLIRLASARGFQILYALPTGQLACRMRQRHPDIHVDTCAGAFLFYRPMAETAGIMAEYDLVVVDEALQLSAEEFGRLREMFLAAGRRLLLLLMGDEWQLPSIQPERACEHPQWRLSHVVTLHEVRRCKCPELQSKLDVLRYHKPTGAEGQRFVNKLCYQHKAWTGHDEPTALDIASVLDRTAGATTFITCTRRGAGVINELAVDVLFINRNKRTLGLVPGDYSDFPENYTDQGRLREDRAPLPAKVPLFAGLRIQLTRNQDKENHYVNGMVATVEAFAPEHQCLRVLTDSGRRLAIYPSRTRTRRRGAELDHITVWLDRKFTKAAAYVALSRVQRDSDYLVGGILTPDHL
ncbi:ATP-dependent DNA helicase PIF1, partial [Durusdinium trenchii]